MKIFVCVKHVPDTAVSIKLTGETVYDDAGIKFIINPYDEHAIEEAVGLVEKNGGEVVVVTVGKEDSVSTIRGALAMGAERAILVKTDSQFLDSRLTALAIKAAIEEDGMGDMIFAGKGAVDTETFQTAYRLAGFMDLPMVNDVSSLTLEEGKATVQREIGGGQSQVIEMQTPCIIGADRGLNEPRYPKFPSIMKAKKKEIKEMDFSALNLDAGSGAEMEQLSQAPERSGAKMIEGAIEEQVDQLITILKQNEKVL